MSPHVYVHVRVPHPPVDASTGHRRQQHLVYKRALSPKYSFAKLISAGAFQCGRSTNNHGTGRHHTTPASWHSRCDWGARRGLLRRSWRLAGEASLLRSYWWSRRSLLWWHGPSRRRLCVKSMFSASSTFVMLSMFVCITQTTPLFPSFPVNEL